MSPGGLQTKPLLGAGGRRRQCDRWLLAALARLPQVIGYLPAEPTLCAGARLRPAEPQFQALCQVYRNARTPVQNTRKCDASNPELLSGRGDRQSQRGQHVFAQCLAGVRCSGPWTNPASYLAHQPPCPAIDS